MRQGPPLKHIICIAVAASSLFASGVSCAGSSRDGMDESRGPGDAAKGEESQLAKRDRSVKMPLPSKIDAGLLHANIPQAFPSTAAMHEWANDLRLNWGSSSSPANALVAIVHRGNDKYAVIAIPAFSGRRAVVLLFYLAHGQGYVLQSANTKGVDLSNVIERPFSIAFDGGVALLKSGEKVLARVPWPVSGRS